MVSPSMAARSRAVMTPPLALPSPSHHSSGSASPGISSTSSPIPAGALTAPASKTSPKPVKLRSACNPCFAAKVRCDGNKQGCRRCADKKLSCCYSESRVGKVVGKRRKRPVDDAIGTVHSKNWIVHATAPFSAQSIPSPATTQGSDESSQRRGSGPSWTTFIAGDAHGCLALDPAADASLHPIDVGACGGGGLAAAAVQELPFFHATGLPTPSLSPPQWPGYLSPAQLETRPASRNAGTPFPVDPSQLHPPRYFKPVPPSLDAVPDDEETVCIKLLAHLKKHSRHGSEPRDAQVELELLGKCTAAMRRILRSPAVVADFACHLLLSSILCHLVRLCERLCLSQRDESLMMDPHMLHDPGLFDQLLPPPTWALGPNSLVVSVSEVGSFVATVADMIKRKPRHGFQTLGRQETLLVELELRLKQATSLLQC